MMTQVAEHIEKDYRHSVRYALIKNGERIEFESEKEACDFLGVRRCSVSSCFRNGYKCKGYDIERIGLSTHGETHTRLHKIWEGMLARCEYDKHPHFKDYGGRGIIVCEEWHDYIKFRDWAVNNGYNDSLTIDRQNTNGNYEPSNCRFITVKEQQNNKRTNRTVCLDGVEHTIAQWSEILGINKTTIKERLNNGWSDKDALTKPVRKRTKGYRPSKGVGVDLEE